MDAIGAEKFMTGISWNDFQKIEIRIGTIVDVQAFPEARNPSDALHGTMR